MFAPYFTTKSTGTGLGLFVCRNLLAEGGGKIELLESSPHGTTFRVILQAPELAGCPDMLPPEVAHGDVATLAANTATGE